MQVENLLEACSRLKNKITGVQLICKVAELTAVWSVYLAWGWFLDWFLRFFFCFRVKNLSELNCFPTTIHRNDTNLKAVKVAKLLDKFTFLRFLLDWDTEFIVIMKWKPFKCHIGPSEMKMLSAKAWQQQLKWLFLSFFFIKHLYVVTWHSRPSSFKDLPTSDYARALFYTLSQKKGNLPAGGLKDDLTTQSKYNYGLHPHFP